MAKRHLKVAGDLGRVVFMVKITACMRRFRAKTVRKWISATPRLLRRVSATPILYTT
jgi:hypothetical protein